MEENKHENKEQPVPEENIPSAETGEPVLPPAEPVVKETEISEIKTIETNQEEMEVHHHTHAGHGKKTWKAYFWEFLMLFLAVFCGFLAEYKLEHVIEHQREKQYVESLLADLKSDQLVLAKHRSSIQKGVLMMDTLTAILTAPEQVSGKTSQLYFLARLGPRSQPLSINNRTFEQLKNSGNFRLIRKLAVSNQIMSYYEQLPLLRMLESIHETEFTQYKSIAAKVFDPAVFVRLESKEGDVLRGTDNPPLRSTNRELLQELSVFAVYMCGTQKGIQVADTQMEAAGAELIRYLQQEYDLD